MGEGCRVGPLPRCGRGPDPVRLHKRAVLGHVRLQGSGRRTRHRRSVPALLAARRVRRAHRRNGHRGGGPDDRTSDRRPVRLTRRRCRGRKGHGHRRRRAARHGHRRPGRRPVAAHPGSGRQAGHLGGGRRCGRWPHLPAARIGGRGRRGPVRRPGSGVGGRRRVAGAVAKPSPRVGPATVTGVQPVERGAGCTDGRRAAGGGARPGRVRRRRLEARRPVRRADHVGGPGRWAVADPHRGRPHGGARRRVGEARPGDA